jgi:hydrogenase nickel incorporation protein HypB
MMDEIRLIEVKEEILSDNKGLADQLRDDLKNSRTFLMNLMSSPGAGKTTFILATIAALKSKFRLGIIEADIDSIVDAEKVARTGVTAIQLRTGGFCHLDAAMVSKGLEALNLSQLDLIIIENVGNLVCPAEFDTGAVKNVMILSVPEGDDKPLKYPLMFSVCDVLIVNKIDYLPLSDFDLAAMRERVLKLNPGIKIFEVSARNGTGIEAWTNWLEQETRTFINP